MKEDGKKDKNLLVRLPKEMHEEARIRAIREGRPLSEIIRELLQKYLAKKQEK